MDLNLGLSRDGANTNIAHNMAITVGHPHPGPGTKPEFGLKLIILILGVAMVYPYFWGSDPIDWPCFMPRLLGCSSMGCFPFILLVE